MTRDLTTSKLSESDDPSRFLAIAKASRWTSRS